MPVLLFETATPDTAPYLLLGYVIIGGVGLIYVISLLVRQRNLKRDLDIIERLQRDEEGEL
jgi:hypothetical protein